MTDFVVPLPDGLAQQLQALPKEKVVEAFTDAAVELVEEAELNDWRERERLEARAAIEEALAEDDAKSVSFERFVERRRAHWKAKGYDFDKDIAEAHPVMEG